MLRPRGMEYGRFWVKEQRHPENVQPKSGIPWYLSSIVARVKHKLGSVPRSRLNLNFPPTGLFSQYSGQAGYWCISKTGTTWYMEALSTNAVWHSSMVLFLSGFDYRFTRETVSPPAPVYLLLGEGQT